MPSFRLVFSSGSVCLLGLSGYLYFSGNPWFYQRVVMPTVTRMDPERAHLAAVWAASRGLVPRDHSKDPAILVGSTGAGNLHAGLKISSPAWPCTLLHAADTTEFAYLRAQVVVSLGQTNWHGETWPGLVSFPDPSHHAPSENWRGKNGQFSEGVWCGGSGDETSLACKLVIMIITWVSWSHSQILMLEPGMGLIARAHPTITYSYLVNYKK